MNKALALYCLNGTWEVPEKAMQLWDVLTMLVDQEIRIVLTEEIEGREEEQYLTRQ